MNSYPNNHISQIHSKINPYFESENSGFNQNRIDDKGIKLFQAQNQLLDEARKELDNKDNYILSLEKKLNGLEGIKNQNENQKRQINYLEEKLFMFEKKFTENKQPNSIILELENVKNQLYQKEKLIRDQENILKDQEKLIFQLKNQVNEKETSLASLRNELNEITFRAKSLISKVESGDEEQKYLKEEQQNKINELNNENQELSIKIKEFIDIIKNQSNQLKEFEIKNNGNEQEINNLLQLNHKHLESIEVMKNENEEQKNQLLKYKNLNDKFIILEDNLNKLGNDCENYKKLAKLKEMEFQDLLNKYNELINKYSGERSFENMSRKINELEKEKINIIQANENIVKINKFLEEQNKESNYSKNEMINALNFEIKEICIWIENYFGACYDVNIEIPNFNLTNELIIKENISIDNLKYILSTSKTSISKQFKKIFNENKEFHNELSRSSFIYNNLQKNLNNVQLQLNESLNLNSNLNNEIKELKSRINSFQEKEIKYKNENINLVNQYDNFLETLLSRLQLSLDKFFIDSRCTKNYKFDYNKLHKQEDLKKELDILISKILELLSILSLESESLVKISESNTLLKSDNERIKNEINQLKNELDKKEEMFEKEKIEIENRCEKKKWDSIGILENDIKTKIDIFSNKLKEKEDELKNSNSETIILRNKIDQLENLIQIESTNSATRKKQLEEKIQRLSELYKDSEIKNNNLIRDIEMKDSQIQSLENLLSRRNKEIEISRKFSNSNDLSLIANNFEVERDNLLKDNLILMNSNINLSNQIKRSNLKYGNEVNFESNNFDIEEKLKIAKDDIKNKDKLGSQLITEKKNFKNPEKAESDNVKKMIRDFDHPVVGTIIRKK